MTENWNIKDLLARDHQVVYKSNGKSMLPLLRSDKDIILIKSLENDCCTKYDVILFVRGNGKYILHRIVKVALNRYWVIGDNCIDGEWVSRNQVIGVLIAIKRNGKTINVTDWKYKLYVTLWCKPWKLRVLILKIKLLFVRVIHGLYRFIRRA